MTFPGLQHVAITVSDLRRSTDWYTRLFGADPVLDEDEEGGEFHHTVYALDGGMLFGLHTHMGREAKDAFDARRTGLDHVSFGLPDSASLEAWGQPARRAGHLPRRDQEGALRLGHLVRRPGRHRARVLHRARDLSTARPRREGHLRSDQFDRRCPARRTTGRPARPDEATHGPTK